MTSRLTPMNRFFCMQPARCAPRSPMSQMLSARKPASRSRRNTDRPERYVTRSPVARGRRSLLPQIWIIPIACRSLAQQPGRAVRPQPALRAGSPGLAVTPETLLETMLREDIKIGTSTPKADPSGDYAFAVFARAEAVKAGSRKTLEQRRSSSQADRRALRDPQAAASMAGTWRKDVPTSSSLTAPVRWWRNARMPGNRLSPCRSLFRWAPTTA